MYWLAAHSLRPMVPLRLDQLGASDVEIGVVVAGYSVFSLFLAVPGGRLVDRLGTLRVLLGSLVGMAGVGIFYALVQTPKQILLLMLVNGVMELGVWLSLQALISHVGTGERRDRHLGLFSICWGVGSAAAPVMGSLVFERFGLGPLGWTYAALALASTVVVFVPHHDADGRLSAADARAASPRRVVMNVVRRPAVKAVLLSSYVGLFINAIRMSFYPVYLERSGMTLSRIGILLSVIAIASLVIRVPLPWMLRRWSPGSVLVWSMWAALLPMAITPWLPSFWLLVAAAVVIGAGYGVNPPVTLSLMANHTDPGERGVAMGMRLTANRMAQISQPLLFGAVAAVMGMGAAFPVSGLVLAAMTGWAGRVATRHAVRPSN